MSDSLAVLGSPVDAITCSPATCPLSALSRLAVGIMSRSVDLIVSIDPVIDDFF